MVLSSWPLLRRPGTARVASALLCGAAGGAVAFLFCCLVLYAVGLTGHSALGGSLRHGACMGGMLGLIWCGRRTKVGHELAVALLAGAAWVVASATLARSPAQWYVADREDVLALLPIVLGYHAVAGVLSALWVVYAVPRMWVVLDAEMRKPQASAWEEAGA